MKGELAIPPETSQALAVELQWLGTLPELDAYRIMQIVLDALAEYADTCLQLAA